MKNLEKNIEWIEAEMNRISGEIGHAEAMMRGSRNKKKPLIAKRAAELRKQLSLLKSYMAIYKKNQSQIK